MRAVPDARTVLRTAVPRPVRRVLQLSSAGLERGQQALFERRLGISTSGNEYPDELGAPSEGRVHYEGCQWIPVRRALRSLDPGAGDVFVDIGAGKGQAMLIAALLPFGRVLGVEVAESLVADGQRNIARARPRLRTPEVEMIGADATVWDVPDDLTVVFLYCPFIGDAFHRSMQNVFDSYDRRPRRLLVVYVYPWEHDWLIASGRVRLVDVLPAEWPAKPWWWRSGWVQTVYEVVPEGRGGPGAPQLRRRWLRPRRAIARWSRSNGHAFRLVRDGRIVAAKHPA